jgi:hypothetical protein
VFNGGENSTNWDINKIVWQRKEAPREEEQDEKEELER